MFGWYNTSEAIVSDLQKCVEEFISSRQSFLRFISHCAYKSNFGLYTHNTKEDINTKYTGSGYLQIEGYSKYEEFSEYISDSKVVDEGHLYVSEHYPFLISGYYWRREGIDSYCCQGISEEEIALRLYGKYEGAENIREYYQRALGIF
ncbi:LysM peptidoglycan-binding domain-containing protein [Histomonas meleagridis]|uniref:LysM peptidoglycan-binding domain-containing protein n=1 Tax=Histomonas meleagridis TaxID=135588 RepID=UPI00355A1932|nr:LysM peptidoglycan-binding domain-containing protein [Histomonas meleagridis]KAH0800247.1 LysM peptidoglycan-binding domain-containing protein [Histomonas meleagridis]